MQSLAHQFLTFCREKPEGEEYNLSPSKCAFTQFLRFAGIEGEAAGSFWLGENGQRHEYPEALNGGFALVESPNTFGALASRLEAALSSPMNREG